MRSLFSENQCFLETDLTTHGGLRLEYTVLRKTVTQSPPIFTQSRTTLCEVNVCTYIVLCFISTEGISVADPGGAAGACPPTGPDSFVLTYKFFET